MPLPQIQFPSAARDFFPRVNFQCRLSLSFSISTPPCAIVCINICAHDKVPVVLVRAWWIMATKTYPARTISDKNIQVDSCGCPTERRKKKKTLHKLLCLGRRMPVHNVAVDLGKLPGVS